MTNKNQNINNKKVTNNLKMRFKLMNKKELKKDLLFFWVAIPGFLGFLYFLSNFLEFLTNTLVVKITKWDIYSIFFITLKVSICWILMLLGTRKLKKWRYGLAILPLPFFAIVLIVGKYIVGVKWATRFQVGIWIVLGISIYLIKRAVKRYEERKIKVESAESIKPDPGMKT